MTRAASLFKKIQPFSDRAAFFAALDEKDGAHPLVLSFCNTHAFNLATQDGAFLAALQESDFLLRDGTGMKWAMRLLGEEPGANMNGTDLIPRLLQHKKGSGIVLLGTKEPWLSGANEALKNDGLTILSTMDGYQPEPAYMKLLLDKKPPIILLAMGMPRQETLAQKLKSALPFPCLIINSGALLDFLAKRFPRAPLSWQRLGLEWLFRLLHEPERLWRRYLLGNASFLLCVFTLKMRRFLHKA